MYQIPNKIIILYIILDKYVEWCYNKYTIGNINYKLPTRKEADKMKRQLVKKVTSFEALPLVMTVKDVQNVLRVSRPNAYRIMNLESFPKMKIGKRVLVEKEAFKFASPSTIKLSRFKSASY